MTSVYYLVLGAGAAWTVLHLQKRDKDRRRAHHKAVQEQKWMHLRKPVTNIKEVVYTKQVGAKEARLLHRERGPHGSVKYVYELPTGQRCMSYLPLDYWTAH